MDLTFFFPDQYRGNRITGGAFPNLKRNGRENGKGGGSVSKNLMGSDPFELI